MFLKYKWFNSVPQEIRCWQYISPEAVGYAPLKPETYVPECLINLHSPGFKLHPSFRTGSVDFSFGPPKKSYGVSGWSLVRSICLYPFDAKTHDYPSPDVTDTDTEVSKV